jgi:outer membrane protein
MTQAEAEEKYRVLNNKMSDYQNLGARKEAEIQEENAVMMNKVMDAIEQYIKKYNDEKKYALILTGVFEGDPKLDITNDIIEGLNNEYVKNKKKGTQTEEAAAEESAPEAEKK